MFRKLTDLQMMFVPDISSFSGTGMMSAVQCDDQRAAVMITDDLLQ